MIVCVEFNWKKANQRKWGPLGDSPRKPGDGDDKCGAPHTVRETMVEQFRREDEGEEKTNVQGSKHTTCEDNVAHSP